MKGVRLWTLVNRSNETIDGIMLKVTHEPGCAYYDVIQGIELYPTIRDGLALLSGSLVPKGMGGFVAGMSSSLAIVSSSFLGHNAGSMPVMISQKRFPSRQRRCNPEKTNRYT